MLELTQKAKDELLREMYLINYKTARKELAKDIKKRLAYRRKELQNVQNEKETN